VIERHATFRRRKRKRKREREREREGKRGASGVPGILLHATCQSQKRIIHARINNDVPTYLRASTLVCWLSRDEILDYVRVSIRSSARPPPCPTFGMMMYQPFASLSSSGNVSDEATSPESLPSFRIPLDAGNINLLLGANFRRGCNIAHL